MGVGVRNPACLLIGAVAAFIVSTLACHAENLCRDPTNDGLCYCPVGASCRHACNNAVPNCTLSCGQKNDSCSVVCAENCTALCAGARRCEVGCGNRCNVSCEWIQERCTATVGPTSHVNCEGARDCDVLCQGACDVSCAKGRCRVQCATPRECEVDCGGGAGPASCPDGSRVCGRSC